MVPREVSNEVVLVERRLGVELDGKPSRVYGLGFPLSLEIVGVPRQE